MSELPTDSTDRRPREKQLLESLQWAIEWIEFCHETPIPIDEQKDWESYDLARELLLNAN